MAKPITQIEITWDIDDVQYVRPDLTDEQAGEVLRSVKHHHDATVGVNWDVLEIHADQLYPRA